MARSSVRSTEAQTSCSWHERGRTTGGCFRISLKAILHIGHVGGSCTCAQCSMQPKQKRCSHPLISPRSSTGLRRVNTDPSVGAEGSQALKRAARAHGAGATHSRQMPQPGSVSALSAPPSNMQPCSRSSSIVPQQPVPQQTKKREGPLTEEPRETRGASRGQQIAPTSRE